MTEEIETQVHQRLREKRKNRKRRKKEGRRERL